MQIAGRKLEVHFNNLVHLPFKLADILMHERWLLRPLQLLAAICSECGPRPPSRPWFLLHCLGPCIFFFVDHKLFNQHYHWLTAWGAPMQAAENDRHSNVKFVCRARAVEFSEPFVIGVFLCCRTLNLLTKRVNCHLTVICLDKVRGITVEVRKSAVETHVRSSSVLQEFLGNVSPTPSSP